MAFKPWQIEKNSSISHLYNDEKCPKFFTLGDAVREGPFHDPWI